MRAASFSRQTSSRLLSCLAQLPACSVNQPRLLWFTCRRASTNTIALPPFRTDSTWTTLPGGAHMTRPWPSSVTCKIKSRVLIRARDAFPSQQKSVTLKCLVDLSFRSLRLAVGIPCFSASCSSALQVSRFSGTIHNGGCDGIIRRFAPTATRLSPNFGGR